MDILLDQVVRPVVAQPDSDLAHERLISLMRDDTASNMVRRGGDVTTQGEGGRGTIRRGGPHAPRQGAEGQRVTRHCPCRHGGRGQGRISVLKEWA